MPSVFYSGNTNSTLFTTCCRCAVLDDQAKCPICHKEITPESAAGRHEVAMQKLYGREGLRKMRAASAEKWRRADAIRARRHRRHSGADEALTPTGDRKDVTQ